MAWGRGGGVVRRCLANAGALSEVADGVEDTAGFARRVQLVHILVQKGRILEVS